MFPSATAARVRSAVARSNWSIRPTGSGTGPARPSNTPPAAQVGPEIVGWAAALVSIQITEGDYTPLSQFDADAADPARFFDRLCDRIEVNRATCRDRERDRRVEDGRDSASDDEQASLADGWS